MPPTPDLDALAAFRRALHRQPEISGEEEQTARRVAKRLQALGPDRLLTGIGGHGVIAQFRGAAPRIRILLRCELDALPIPEQNAFAHVSQVPGKGHLCGHDGHMAILMGVAESLAARRADHADVVLLFQPAEETGAGAAAVLADPAFRDFLPDVSFALHNMPGLPLGQVDLRGGAMCCASRGLKIALTGRIAHASQPETGTSPAAAMMEIMQGLQALNVASAQRGAVPDRMVTLTHARMGEPTFGVAPGEAEIFATLRTIRDDDMAALCNAAEALARDAAAGAGLGLETSYHDVFPAVTNDPALIDTVADAAKAAGLTTRDQPQVMRFSEDFAHFGKVSPAALFLLGAGEDVADLHNPDYDFPDALIGPGIAAFLEIIDRAERPETPRNA